MPGGSPATPSPGRTAPPVSYPPTCPAGSTWNGSSCVSYVSTYAGYGPANYIPAAGPNIVVTQDAQPPQPFELSKGTKIALALFGIGVLAIGAVAAFRK